MQNKIIIFDFDGVLVNTLPRWFDLSKEHNPWITHDQFKDLSNGNFHETITKMQGENTYTVPSENEKHHQAWLREIEVTPEMQELIKELSQNYSLFVVSSALSSNIIEHFERVNLIKYFQSILGFDIHTSKIIKINCILEEENVLPENCIFVTDTLGDIREGNVCKVHSIGVTWGLHERETLEKGEPYAIVDNVEELKNEINRIFSINQ